MKNAKTKNNKSKRDKFKAWLTRQKIAVKLWLYRKALFVSLGFIGLNAVDGYLTNYAHRLAVTSGIQGSIEANPFLSLIAGHWALSFKGLLGAGAVGLIAYLRHFTPSKLMWYMIFGCAVFVGIIIWNLYLLRAIL